VSRRNRIFLGILILFALGVSVLLYRVATDLDSRYRESTEETLVDVAYLMAASIESDMQDAAIDATRLQTVFRAAYGKNFEAKIFNVIKRHVNMHVYVTDAKGTVVFDSLGKVEGRDFSTWRDVARALAGQYGARTSLEEADNPDTAVMYVAAPIMHDGAIVGAVSVGKPVSSQREFVATAREKLMHVGLITVMAFLLLLVVLSVWLARPFGLTADLVRVLRQEGMGRPRRTWRRLRTVLGSAFNDMRDAVAGRSNTEEYVETLTHELKSPLTAIRGAAELLREPLPDAQRERFSANISEQVLRLQNLADRLLQLANLEKRRTLDEVQTVDLQALVREAVDAVEPIAHVKKITLTVDVTAGAKVEGDRFLLCQALVNVLSNAIDFAPASSPVDVAVQARGRMVEISVRDRGPGVPDFALDRAFEKFYSLRRPDSGRKSTGLGLAFVREIAHLHGGKAQLSNHPDGGALAAIELPAVLR
jgi:two-component system sensor histidine kinase CreC